MSLSALGSLATVTPVVRHVLSGVSGFVPPVAVGHGKAAHGHPGADARSQETGAAGIAPVHSLAADTRALVGDVFGALGATTPSATTARQAVQAYRQVG